MQGDDDKGVEAPLPRTPIFNINERLSAEAEAEAEASGIFVRIRTT